MKHLNKKVYVLRQRMYEEATMSLEMAETVVALLHQDGVTKYDVEIHVDIGKFGDTRDMISEIVGNDGWRSGNSIGLMIKGLAANPNNKFFIGNFDSDPNLSAKLTINYSR